MHGSSAEAGTERGRCLTGSNLHDDGGQSDKGRGWLEQIAQVAGLEDWTERLEARAFEVIVRQELTLYGNPRFRNPPV